MRTLACATAAALAMTAFGRTPADADQRKFTYSYEAKTLPEGSIEFEQWLTLRTRKEEGHFNTAVDGAGTARGSPGEQTVTEGDILSKSADEALYVVERHRDLLCCVKKVGDARIETCFLLDCPHRRKLRETLVEAVEIPQETRKAFKAKQLAVLRKQLVGALAEDAGPRRCKRGSPPVRRMAPESEGANGIDMGSVSPRLLSS